MMDNCKQTCGFCEDNWEEKNEQKKKEKEEKEKKEKEERDRKEMEVESHEPTESGNTGP